MCVRSRWVAAPLEAGDRPGVRRVDEALESRESEHRTCTVKLQRDDQKEGLSRCEQARGEARGEESGGETEEAQFEQAN